MQPVKDSIHDYIRLDDLGADLIETPAIQRLRHIKQLSTVRLVSRQPITPGSSTVWGCTIWHEKPLPRCHSTRKPPATFVLQPFFTTPDTARTVIKPRISSDAGQGSIMTSSSGC